jgi:acyl-coenzyme A synthetase/AMP-(fatty) acid ligase
LVVPMDDLNSRFATCFAENSTRDAIYTADGQTLSFGRVERAASQIAQGMVQRGVKPGDTVICLLDSFALNLCAWFAIWRLGCNLAASASVENFSGSGVRIDAALMSSDQTCGTARQLLFDQSWMDADVEVLPPVLAGSIYFPTTHTPRDLSVLRMTPDQLVEDARIYDATLGGGHGAAYLSTPVDSMRSFRDVLRAFQAGRAVLGPDVPLDQAWQAIQRAGATELFVAPMSLHKLTEAASAAGGADVIKRVFVGTGTAQQNMLKRAIGVFSGARFDLAAGTPETSFYAHKIYDPDSHQTGQIGQVVGALVAQIRDADDQPLGADQAGSLAIWVPPAARLEGYLNRQPAYDADGWCTPGFLAQMDAAGNVTKLGRTDDRINIGGARYFSGKIEAALDTLPMVRRTAVIRVFDASGAEAMGIVVEPTHLFNGADFDALLQRGFRFVGETIVRATDALPMTPQGGPDRARLAEIWDDLTAP